MKEEVKNHLTPGVLETIHKTGIISTETVVVQIVKKIIVEGQLKSLTLSDGEFISENVYPVDEESANMLKEIPTYDLLKLEAATLKDEKLFLNDVTHFEMFDNKGKQVHFNKAIELTRLRMLGQTAIDRYAKQFSKLTRVEFNSKEQSKNDKTEKRKDIVDQLETQSQPPPASSRVKRNMNKCPFCVRSYTDNNDLKKHIRYAHV